ncbi:toll-like receptor Tollo [Argonauta hians]
MSSVKSSSQQACIMMTPTSVSKVSRSHSLHDMPLISTATASTCLEQRISHEKNNSSWKHEAMTPTKEQLVALSLSQISNILFIPPLLPLISPFKSPTPAIQTPPHTLSSLISHSSPNSSKYSSSSSISTSVCASPKPSSSLYNSSNFVVESTTFPLFLCSLRQYLSSSLTPSPNSHQTRTESLPPSLKNPLPAPTQSPPNTSQSQISSAWSLTSLSFSPTSISFPGMIILFLLLLSSHSAQPWVTQPEFICPIQCECHNLRTSQLSTSIAARCRINETMSRYNFTVFSAPYITVLVIQCQGKALNPVNKMFRNLPFLEELVFKDCYFKNIPEYTLSGLSNLKNFSIFGADHLSLTANLFQKVVKLKNLEIIRSGFKSIPNDILCNSVDIELLTLSQNELTHVSELKKFCLTNTTILDQIARLDLSYNLIQIIPAEFSKLFPDMQMVNFVGNRIEKIENGSVSGLYYLTVMDLSKNRIRNFPHDFLENSFGIQQLGISFNPVTTIFPYFKQLLDLEVFEAEHTFLDNTFWREIPKASALTNLNLAHCGISKINKSVMGNLKSLRRLNLNSNSILSLPSNVFSSNDKLHVLILSNNSIEVLMENSLQGLKSLRELDISYNNISVIGEDAFHDLLVIEKLDLSFNKLHDIPSAIAPLDKIQELYLEGNFISKINKNSFKGLDSINRIVLSKNRIVYLDASSFTRCFNLHILDLSENNISAIHNDAFEGLQLVGVSLANNKIRNIGTALWKQHNLSQVHLQGNLLEAIMSSNFPENVKFLNVSHNKIWNVHPFTFSNKDTLVEVDLRYNNISVLENDAISVSHRVRSIPEVYLIGNPFKCDCKIVWLKKLADVRPRKKDGLPYIPDLNELQCHGDNESSVPTGRMYEVNEADFLCKYLKECSPDCICCHYGMCDCNSICPEQCNCYRSYDRKANIINCMNSGLSDSRMLPSNATKIYLSGNRLISLSKHSFLRQRELLTVLYLNRSHISNIQNGTFMTLINLKQLYIHDNDLTILTKETFQGLENLEIITLNSNSISYIAPGMFSPMPKLKVVDVSSNRLHVLDTSFLSLKYLESIAIHNNPWICKCPFVMGLQELHINKPDLVVLSDSVICDHEDVLNSSMSFYTAYPLFEFDVQLHCLNITPAPNLSAQVNSQIDTKVICALAIFSVIFLTLIIAVIIIACYREEIKVWLFTQYGWRIGDPWAKLDDSNRRYDVFVAYTSKNAMFVEHELTPRLERREPPYQVCLTYRDYDVDISYAQNTINCIQNSKRTIMLVSNDFFQTEWFRYDFQINNHDILKTLSERLIVILMEKVDRKKLECDLMFYAKTKKFLKYQDTHFWDKLYYMLPKVRGLPLLPQTPESAVSSGELRDQCCNNIAFSKTSLESGYEEINFVRKNVFPRSDHQTVYLAPVCQRNCK